MFVTMKSSTERQREHRARVAARIARQEDALRRILARLEKNDKPLAREIAGIAQEGLNG